MRSDKIFYSLNIQDIQTVALDVLDRKLSEQEVEQVLDPISDRIPWHEIIEDVIIEKIKSDKSEM